MSKHSKEAAQKSPITTNKTPTTSDRQVFESTLEAMIKNKPAALPTSSQDDASDCSDKQIRR